MMQLLDAVFSSVILFMILLLLVGSLGMFLGFSRPFRSSAANQVLSIFSIAAVFGLTLLMVYTRYIFALGKVFEFTDIQVSQKYIFLVDKQYQGDSDGMGDNFFRLITLDKASGERLGRVFAGEYGEIGTIILQFEDSVWVKTGSGILGIKTLENRVFFSDNPKDLSTQFTEFKVGIDQVEFLARDSLLAVKAKDGRMYNLDIRSQKLKETKAIVSKRVDPVFEKDFIRLSQNQSIYLSGPTRKQLLSNPYTAEANVLSPLDFLEGFFIGWSPQEQICLILHYETTDKNNFTLSAFSTQNLEKPLWEIQQKNLKASDFFSKPENTLDCLEIDGQDVYFTVGGFLFKAKLSTGEIYQQKRL